MGAQAVERNVKTIVCNLGSPSADALLPFMKTYRKIELVSVQLMNGANIAASDTDYVILELKNGSTVIAEIDTRAAHENGLALNTAENLNIVSGLATVAKDVNLTVNYNETDSGTAVALTNAQLIVHYMDKQTA